MAKLSNQRKFEINQEFTKAFTGGRFDVADAIDKAIQSALEDNIVPSQDEVPAVGAAVPDAPAATTPAVQAFGRIVATGFPVEGDTWTVTVDPAGINHVEVFTAVSGAPANDNEVSLVGDGVQNLADAIAANFPANQLSSVKENATTVKITLGSLYVGAAGNGKLRIQTTSAFTAIQDVDGSGFVQNGVNGTSTFDADDVGSTLNALLASLRAAGIIS